MKFGSVQPFRNDASNVWALRNGTVAQGLRLYNTTDAGLANYERGVLQWSGNALYIQTEKAGTGSARDLSIGTGVSSSLILRTNGTSRWYVDATSGSLLAFTDASPVIGSSGTNRPAGIFLSAHATIGTNPAATGEGRFPNNAFGIRFRNAANTADVTALYVNALNEVVIQDGALGVRLGNHASAGIGLFATAPVGQRLGGVTITNNITAGGTTNQLDNWTDLTTYATDAAAIRNACYQLGRKQKLIVDALRTIGLCQNADA